MTIEGYLKIPNIPGDSTREGHEDEIEVHGFTFSMAAPQDGSGSARRGRVSYDTVVVSKDYDSSSPALKGALAVNLSLGEVVLSVRRAVEGESNDYLVITLDDVSLVRYDLAPAQDRDGVLTEHLGLAYRSIKFTYEHQYEVELEARTAR